MNKENKKDINCRDDIFNVVRNFYEKAVNDPIIGYFFEQVVPLNLDTHVPKVVDFWDAVLFGSNPLESGKRMGNMLNAHLDVDAKARMQTGHFTRWLFLFHKSIDTQYEGENAEALKNRASKMANSMSDAIRSKRGENRVGVQTLDKSTD